MKIARHGFLGLLGGTLAAFIIIAMCLVLTVATESAVEVPGLITATFRRVNDLPEVEFLPNGYGVLAIVVIGGIVPVILGLVRSRNARTR
jgi:hypothetical protein